MLIFVDFSEDKYGLLKKMLTLLNPKCKKEKDHMYVIVLYVFNILESETSPRTVPTSQFVSLHLCFTSAG